MNYTCITLDLRSTSVLSKEVRNEFLHHASKSRSVYNHIICDLKDQTKSNPFLWFHQPFSRNTYANSTFYNFAAFKYLEHCFNTRSKSISYRITVDSIALKRIIVKLANLKSINISVKYKSFSFNKLNFLKFKVFKPIITSIFRYLQYIICSLSRNKSLIHSTLLSKQLILLDVFMTPHKRDEVHWYGTLINHLNSTQKQSFYFVPTFTLFNLFDFFRLIPSIRNSNTNKLLKEDLLHSADFFFSFCHLFRNSFIRLSPIIYNEINITPLFQESYDRESDLLSLYECYLTDRFFYRCSLNKLNIIGTFDWFEGHAIDKAWNYALKQYYPKSIRIGHRSIITLPFSLCSIPLAAERKVGILPDVFMLPGPAVTKIVKEFDDEIIVYPGPALRFEHIQNFNLDRNHIHNKNQFNVLITLPISEVTSLSIIDSLMNILGRLNTNFKDITFWVRKHPASDINLSYISELDNKYLKISTHNSLADCFKSTDLLLTEASSTSMEALALGIPVIIVSTDKPGLHENPVPNDISEEYVKRISSNQQLLEAINWFLELRSEKLNELQSISDKVKKQYFLPVNTESVQKMLSDLIPSL